MSLVLPPWYGLLVEGSQVPRMPRVTHKNVIFLPTYSYIVIGVNGELLVRAHEKMLAHNENWDTRLIYIVRSKW